MNWVRPFLLVDAFAERPFTGNPAGVVLNAEGLGESQMQAIAGEVRASETAFLSRAEEGQGFRLRWFTPSIEVRFCGHATLASAEALRHRGLCKPEADGLYRARFDTLAGPLELHAQAGQESPHAGPLWWLRMPAPEYQAARVNAKALAALLGADLEALDASMPIYRTADDLIVFVRQWQLLQALQPRYRELADWCARERVRGVTVSTTHTLTPAAQVCSRFFAPAAGVDEDPVTGSMHGPLAAVLVEHNRVPLTDNRADISCLQGIPGGRGGLVRVRIARTGSACSVHIGGRCAPAIVGEVAIPEPKS